MKDIPAFPSHGNMGEVVQTGMSLRDYFAAAAPVEVPSWFIHSEPPWDLGAPPNVAELDETHREAAQAWLLDGCFDLPDELDWWCKKVESYRQRSDEWTRKNQCARYVQWRWAYADAMLAERERKADPAAGRQSMLTNGNSQE